MSSEITVLNEMLEEQRKHIAELVSQVEDLRLQFDLVLNERNEVMDENASAKSVHEALVRNLTSMCNTAAKAFAERDEARRELCMIVSGKAGKSAFVSNDAVEIARERQWDCFRENP